MPPTPVTKTATPKPPSPAMPEAGGPTLHDGVLLNARVLQMACGEPAQCQSCPNVAELLLRERSIGPNATNSSQSRSGPCLHIWPRVGPSSATEYPSRPTYVKSMLAWERPISADLGHAAKCGHNLVKCRPKATKLAEQGCGDQLCGGDPIDNPPMGGGVSWGAASGCISGNDGKPICERPRTSAVVAPPGTNIAIASLVGKPRNRPPAWDVGA